MEQFVGRPRGAATGTIVPGHGVERAERQAGLRGIEPPKQTDQQDHQSEDRRVKQALPPDGTSLGVRVPRDNGRWGVHERTFSFGMPL